MRPVAKSALPVLAGLFLSSCGWLFGSDAGSSDPADAAYRDAMAAFSDCATASDPATRAAAAASLAQAEAAMAAETRPRNPDHFFMLDRVRAARGFCDEAAGF